MIELTDRYKILGIPYPDPQTVCKGQCEGTGMVPTYRNETDPECLSRWIIEHCKYEHECDGWHFITCPDCEGTGKNNI
jgi:DnaJ-class molecular chaperone